MREIVKVDKDNLEVMLKMALVMWTETEYIDMKKAYECYLENPNHLLCIFKLDEEFVAFAHFSVRGDYVEGSSTSPVGYIDSIFVKQSMRRHKIAQEMVAYGEKWAKENGCKEMGSDATLSNSQSIGFHEDYGYKEVDRLICFIKEI